MFVFRFFQQSFHFKTIFKNLNEKMWKYIVYFVLIVLISNFPASFEVIKQEGSRLDFIVEDFNNETPTNWNLPVNMEIKAGKLQNYGDTTEYVNEFSGITYIINKQDKINDPLEYKDHLILFESSIVFIDSKGNVLQGFDYLGFSMDNFRFKELELASGDDLTSLYNSFASSIEKSFKKDIVLFTLLRNNLSHLLINAIYVLLLAALVMLFKFGYQNFISFKQSIKLVILCLTLPSLLTFFIGLLSVAFAPVIFQLASGMAVMLVVMIFAKKEFS